MIATKDGIKIYVYLEAVDMRKSVNGLSALAASHFEPSLQDGHLYLFFGKTRNKLKCLFWDRNGFVLYYKRLEHKQFLFPKGCTDDHLEISN